MPPHTAIAAYNSRKERGNQLHEIRCMYGKALPEVGLRSPDDCFYLLRGCHLVYVCGHSSSQITLYYTRFDLAFLSCHFSSPLAHLRAGSRFFCTGKLRNAWKLSILFRLSHA